MSRNNHPVEQEELMAYLDGELATDRAVEAAAHLERCAECQEFVAGLKKLSQEMMTWEVEETESAGMPTDIAVAMEKLEKGKKEPAKKRFGGSWRGMLLTPRRLAWAGSVAVFFLAISGIMLFRMWRTE